MKAFNLRVLWTSTFRTRCLRALEVTPDAILRFRGALVHRARTVEILLAESDPAKLCAVRVFRAPAALRRVSHHYWTVFERGWHREPTLDLAIDGPRGGSGALLHRGHVHRIHAVQLVGGAADPWTPGAQDAAESAQAAASEVPREGRHSRYAGALGGIGALRRLQRMGTLFLGDGLLADRLADDLTRSGISVDRRNDLSALDARQPLDAELLVCVGSSGVPTAAEWANRFLRPLLVVQPVHETGGPPTVRIELHVPGAAPGCPACKLPAAPVRPYAPLEVPVPLQHAALGSALTLLERHVAGGTETSTPIEWRLDTHGSLSSGQSPSAPSAGCPVCRVLGFGRGLPGLDTTFRRYSTASS